MEHIEFSHTSVLLWECIAALDIRDGFTYVDCTTGGGGHSLEIAKRLGPNSRLICLDRDTEALAAAKERLSAYLDKVTFVHTNFENIGRVLDELQIANLGGVLADLGCSSHQFDTPERGFSYMFDAPLDMRMDASEDADGITAYDVVNTYSVADLRRIFFDYGEEKFSSQIARAIETRRQETPIKTTHELVDVIKSAIPAAARKNGPHPAKRVFQAIRIEVNHELDSIPCVIRDSSARLAQSGKLVIISFHSLEDRLVKNTYAELAQGCTCPRDFPVCICGKKPTLTIETRKPILPSEEELEINPRSRSAKLRVASKND